MRVQMIVLVTGLVFQSCNQSQSQTTSGNVSTTAARESEQDELPDQRPLIVDAKALTLRELVQNADRIVQGVVLSTEITNQTIAQGAATSPLAVREVRLRLSQVLKGEGLQPGGELVVRQMAEASSPLRVGQEVLWYLSPNSSLGLTQPLGVYSGDFRLTDGPSGKQATNLRGNEGLWLNSLWTGTDSFNRTAVIETARQLKFPSNRIRALENVGAADDSPRSVPLELLLAATTTAVRSKQ
jgi:hypothetical protein